MWTVVLDARPKRPELVKLRVVDYVAGLQVLESCDRITALGSRQLRAQSDYEVLYEGTNLAIAGLPVSVREIVHRLRIVECGRREA